MATRDLLLGCGAKRDRILSLPGQGEWGDLTTLDINPEHNPDKIWDISDIPLPFDDDTFDSISAFEVMEHVGQQGDWRFFFAQWSDIWRILKNGGVFFGTSPHHLSPWCWGDPGHTRIVGAEQLTYLSQPNYTAQVGITPMTDYRFVYKADFDLIHSMMNEASQYEYALKAVKPSRISNGR